MNDFNPERPTSDKSSMDRSSMPADLSTTPGTMLNLTWQGHELPLDCYVVFTDTCLKPLVVGDALCVFGQTMTDRSDW